MKNNKKALLGVAFIASIIALAGVGYAVTHPGYQGSATISVQQDYDVDYVVVKFDPHGSAFTPDTTFYLTWNTNTQYDNTTPTTTYTWQASDVLVHGLVIQATDPATDSYMLKATAPTFTGTGYKLYYKVSTSEISDETPVTAANLNEWTEFTNEAPIVNGGIEVTTPVAIGSDDVVEYVAWVAVPSYVPGDAPTSAPSTTVNIRGFTYTVEASQPNNVSP